MTLGRQASGVRRQAGEDPVFSAEKTPQAATSRKPRPGYDILKAVLDALDRRAIPAPDEKLKEIVGGQIKALIKAGYPVERIRRFAVELALSWDNSRGHQRLLGLRQAVLQDDADREYKAHEQRTRDLDGAPQDPDTRAALLAGIRKGKEAMRPSQTCCVCGQFTDSKCPTCVQALHGRACPTRHSCEVVA